LRQRNSQSGNGAACFIPLLASCGGGKLNIIMTTTMTEEEEVEIHRQYNDGNYAGAYIGGAADERNHWAYCLGFYSNYENDEGPDWLAGLREERNATLALVGITTD